MIEETPRETLANRYARPDLNLSFDNLERAIKGEAVMQQNVFQSKRFWSAVVGLAALVISSFIPELKIHIDTLAPAIVGIVGVLIGGYAIEDVAEAKNRK